MESFFANFFGADDGPSWPCSSEIFLSGTGPFYSATPNEGASLTANAVIAPPSDFVSSGGSIVSVLHFILAEQSPGTVSILAFDDATPLVAAPGDKLRIRAVVTDSLGVSANFDSAEVVVTMAPPEVTQGVTFSAAPGATSFAISFGAAGPVGSSPMLGAYAPSHTPSLTINGSDRVAQLTLVSGTDYTWSGPAVVAGDVIAAFTTWTNLGGTTVSPTVTQTVSDFGFVPIGNNQADLIVADGVDIFLGINADNYGVTAANLAAMPHWLEPVSIAGTAEIGATFTGTPGVALVNVDDPAPTYSWRKDGVATGSTALTYTATANGSYVLRETIGAEFSDSNAIVVAAGSVWSLTPTAGGVIVNTIPARPSAPIIASVGAGTVTIG